MPTTKPLVSLCHSTNRLPTGWFEAVYRWLEACDHPETVEYVISFDKERARAFDFGALSCPAQFERLVIAVNHGPRSAVAGWNTTAQAATGKLLITVSDDYFPPEHWDTLLLKCIPDLDGEYVLDVDNQDGAVGMLPFSFLTRAYMDRLIRERGYAGFFYPRYFGMQGDTDFYHCAKLDDVIINARHIKFRHLNPEKGDVPWDSTYEWQRREEAQEVGRRVFAEREKGGFRPYRQRP